MDNGIETETKKCITWQFDHATNLIALITNFKDFFNASTKALWDNWPSKVCNIETADDFGLSMWGKVLNCERPYLTISSSKVLLSTANYRNVLKARAKLLHGNASVPSYIEYVNTIFGNGVTVSDGNDMSLSFTVNGNLADPQLVALVSQYPDIAFVYPAGVRSNASSTGLMFGLADVSSGRTKAQVIADYPRLGGLDEASLCYGVN